MRVGVPKEIKASEYRVGLVPAYVHELVAHGHEVIVEHDAGAGIGCSDDQYAAAGATVATRVTEVFERAELIVKVKEPQASERKQLRAGQVLFTYLHLAPDPEQAKDLIASKATCIAYETVTAPAGGLPLLAPMSEVAGRMAVQAGAYFLEKSHGGLGVLLGGVPGVPPAHIAIFGGGVVGMMATRLPDLAAGAPFYGSQPGAADTAKIKAPLLIHYAENDPRINAGWPAWEEALKANKVNYTMRMYPGTQHGFHNDTTPRYDEAAAKLAWSRTLDFFELHLRG